VLAVGVPIDWAGPLSTTAPNAKGLRQPPQTSPEIKQPRSTNDSKRWATLNDWPSPASWQLTDYGIGFHRDAIRHDQPRGGVYVDRLKLANTETALLFGKIQMLRDALCPVQPHIVIRFMVLLQ
jgi:hypothetical protein